MRLILKLDTPNPYTLKSKSLHSAHRPHSSSFLGLPYRILNMNPRKELLCGL